MHSRLISRGGLLALVVGAVGSSGGMTGCAQERDPINRVQLNAIPKSFFVGAQYENPIDDPEFYARTMVIDVPYGESSSGSLMFTNTINSMSKIKWSIEESFLIGRISFERVNGTDGNGKKPTQPAVGGKVAQNDGQVVYQFKITKQFDIRRDYNQQTGEENNVIDENDRDRPWTARDYIRVDFSKNLNTSGYDFDTLALLNIYNGIKYSPMEFDVRNPNDVNAPVLDFTKGYFDITNKVFAEPQMVKLGGDFELPGCMLPNVISGGTEPWGNCNANEITLRHSFRRVTDTDYEAADWDGKRFETYGAFVTERNGYARDYGLADASWKRYISRYNIWERSHKYSDPTLLSGGAACKTDDQCQGVSADFPGASRCDQVRSLCTLPYNERKSKPVVWHYSDKSSATYYEPTREAAEEWDTAMRVAVLTARYAECKAYAAADRDCGPVITGNFAQEEDAIFLTKEINACRRGEVNGTAPTACNALADSLAETRGYAPVVAEVAKLEPMVILCHSPVAAADPTVCGEKGTVARLGDLRFHLVTAVDSPETRSPWGIMSDSNDPTTGEHVAASINVWTHVNDLFARGLVDTMRYIAGEFTTDQITDGKYVHDWVEAARAAGGAEAFPQLSRDETDKRIAGAAGSSLAALRKQQTQSTLSAADTARFTAAMEKVFDKVRDTRASAGAPSVSAPLYEARRNAMKGSAVEAAVLTPAMQQLASSGFGPLAATPSAMANATSIFRGLNPQLRRDLERTRELSLAARGACVMGFEALAPLGYVGLGDILQQKFGAFDPKQDAATQNQRAEKMKSWIAHRAHYGVIAHEMGHSFGLRHNFVSSSDAWNFRPQYWQLRTNDKATSKKACPADGTLNGATCTGPRWTDPVTANESKNLLSMFTHSSTMEYAGEPTQDFLGLGAYDFGAARMFYGDSAAVYAGEKYKKGTAAGNVALAHANDFGGLLGFNYGRNLHYSGLDGAADLISSCQEVRADDFRPVNWNDDRDGAWHHVLDGHIVTNEAGKTTRCKQPEVDFVRWEKLQDTTVANRSKPRAIDADNHVRVPHGFASDDWADLGNVAVYRHDNGADVYEQMHFWIAQQEMTHIFQNYRRGRRDFSVWGAFQRTLGRYHEKMRDAAKGIGLFANMSKDQLTTYNYPDSADPQAFAAAVLQQVAPQNAIASSIAFDYFTHVFSRPQPGDHGLVGAGDPVIRSHDGTGLFDPGHDPMFKVANGVTGGFGVISLGGRPVENKLADDQGRDYNRYYTLNVGSYYEKAFTAFLLTESADNFISSSRDDFVDPRARSVSMADVFPDGFRRWLANNLTGDDAIKGVFTAGADGVATLDKEGYVTLGTTSWWPQQGMEVCFPSKKPLNCRDPWSTENLRTTAGPVIDAQVGWEQQKFATLFTMLYLPSNQKQQWLDQLRIYEVGPDNDPGFTNRIEFHDPTGRVYVAQTFGTEVLLGKTVQRGIAARVLEYANELLAKGVQTTPVTQNGVTWRIPQLGADRKVVYLSDGAPVSQCENSRDCTKLKNYTTVPTFLREALQTMGYTRAGGLKGVY